MFIREVGTSLLRRWYLTLVGLIATAGLCVGALNVVPPSYELKANVVLLPPASSVEPGANPYLQLDGLNTVVDVLTRALRSQEMVDLVHQTAPTAEYTVAQDFTTNSPIIVVTVTDSTSVATRATLNMVLEQVPSTLKELQDPLKIASNSQVTSMVLTKDEEPTTIGKTRLRIAIVVVGLGLAVTVLLVALIDGLVARRRGRTSQDEDSSKLGAGRGPAKGRSAVNSRRDTPDDSVQKVATDTPEDNPPAPETTNSDGRPVTSTKSTGG